MARGFTTNGKQVIDSRGEHFADAASPVAALLIVCALEMRKHRPAIDGDRVICSRCQSELPHEGHEPCTPRTPRCSQTPDMFEGECNADDAAQVPLRKTG
jgi:hypothetical protein